MAQITDIADAIVTALNEHDFSQEFLAERAYLPKYDLKDMGELHVTVVPKSIEGTVATRTVREEHYKIDVAVQQHFSEGDNQTVDYLTDLVEEIADFLLALDKSAVASGKVVQVVNEPIYAVEHMKDARLFTSVLTVTVVVWR